MKIRPIFKTIDIFSFIQFLSRQTNYIIKFFLLKVLYLVRVGSKITTWTALEPIDFGAVLCPVGIRVQRLVSVPVRSVADYT